MQFSFEQYKSMIEGWGDTKCIVIGDIMLDHYYQGIVERISPEAPVPVFEVASEEDRLGGAANVALNLANLGANVQMISVTGNDSHAQNLISAMKKNMIQTEIVLSDERTTTVKNRLIAKNQQILRFDHEMKNALSAGETTLLEKKLIEGFKAQPDVVVVQDYNKGVLTPGVIDFIIQLCKQNKIPFVVDPKKENFFSYHGAALFKPNLGELKVALQKDGLALNENEVVELVRECRTKLNAQKCMVTLSEKGLYFEGEKSFLSAPAKVRNIADVSGAGDTVTAVAALCVAQNTDDESLAFLANLSGGIVCEHPGVFPISKELLLKDLKSLR